MSAIKSMQELRTRVLKAFEDLESGAIDISQASTLAKLSETVISGLKSEMQYSILTGSEPHIAFYGAPSGKELDHKVTKKLL